MQLFKKTFLANLTWLTALLKLCLSSTDTENPHTSQHWARSWGSTGTQGSGPALGYSWEGPGTSILRNTQMWRVLGESTEDHEGGDSMAFWEVFIDN